MRKLWALLLTWLIGIAPAFADYYMTSGSGTGGTVTSVALTGDGVLFNSSITGSPITSTGTFDLSSSIKTFAAHKFYGNNTGSTATPSAQTIGAGDIPADVVYNDTSNTYSGTHTQDFSASGTTLKVPIKSAPGSPSAGEVWLATPLLQYADNAGTPAAHTLAIRDTNNLFSASQSPSVAAANDLGTALLPWGNLYVGTAATNNNKITSVATASARTFTLPDANSNSVIPSSASTHQFATAVSSGGVISYAQPAFSDLSGSATGAQLPNPSASTLGGVESIAAVSHNFLTSISTSGVPAQAQPAFTDISGTATGAQLPNPSSSTLGGVQSIASVSHNFLTTISTSGVPAQAQPAFTDISGTATPTQVAAVFNHCRIYTSTGAPYTDGSSSGDATLYFGPCSNLGQYLTSDDGSGNLTTKAITEVSLSLTLTSASVYDVYVYINAGTTTLETDVWSNATTPLAHSTDAAGRLTKSAATNKLFVGVIEAVGTNKTGNWTGERCVSNIYNQHRVVGSAIDATASWAYATNTVRAANASSTDGTGRILVVFNGVDKQNILLTNFQQTASASAGVSQPLIGIGIDSTTTTSFQTQADTPALNTFFNALSCTGASGVLTGSHYLSRLESSVAADSVTFYGGSTQSGMTTEIWQ